MNIGIRVYAASTKQGGLMPDRFDAMMLFALCMLVILDFFFVVGGANPESLFVLVIRSSLTGFALFCMVWFGSKVLRNALYGVPHGTEEKK